MRIRGIEYNIDLHTNDLMHVPPNFTGVVFEESYERVIFIKNGEWHREDGPAEINVIEDEEGFEYFYWLDDEDLCESSWLARTSTLGKLIWK